jgi:predicted lactoylglutathione lyase
MSDAVAALIGGVSAAVISAGTTLAMKFYEQKTKKAEKAEKKDDSTTAALRILLYDRIKHLGKKHIAEGCIDTDALEDLIEMHKVYHDDLDGNGFLDKIMHQVKSLPIKTK